MNLLNTALMAAMPIMAVSSPISAWVLILSIKEMDAGGAWGWAAIFLLASLLSAWCFWRVV